MWLPYAFLRFFLSFAAGILAAVYYPNFQIEILYLIIGAILVYLSATFFTNVTIRKFFSVFYDR